MRTRRLWCSKGLHMWNARVYAIGQEVVNPKRFMFLVPCGELQNLTNIFRFRNWVWLPEGAKVDPERWFDILEGAP